MTAPTCYGDGRCCTACPNCWHHKWKVDRARPAPTAREAAERLRVKFRVMPSCSVCDARETAALLAPALADLMEAYSNLREWERGGGLGVTPDWCLRNRNALIQAADDALDAAVREVSR